MGRTLSFEFLDKVELFVRTGTFPADASKSSKKVTRAASKHFTYKDGRLWRTFRGRLLRVVRSHEEMREILIRYHDNNNHAGQCRAVKEIMLMYYWIGVTPAVKSWIKNCVLCKSRTNNESHEPPIQCCLAYSCDATSYIYPELTFHRFPKDAVMRQKWLAVAHRDEGSLRTNSYLCSQHFESSCFTLNEDGQLTLSPDAVPTVISVEVNEEEAAVPTDEDVLDSNSLEDFFVTSHLETNDPSELVLNQSEMPVQLQEHQYCLPAPDPYYRAVQTVKEDNRRKTTIEPSFVLYNQLSRYLSHRVVPLQSKKGRSSFRRMAKRFGLIDGVLMYTRVSPPVRVPRSREEVNSILQQFHDNQSHSGQGICQQNITKHFYWSNMTRDLARWIASCHTCLNRTKRKWLRCSIYSCTNCCGPVERGLGLTFHEFPLHNAALLAQWLKAVGRPKWHPRLRSSICSTHFTEDCFDRGGQKVTLRPDAVPTLLVHGDIVTKSSGPTQPALGEEAYFAKFDAAELYLRRRIYPPGLSFVEKNTFRRFCRNFAIKDDELHTVKGDRECLVLRNREQVQAVLNDYHNELNHLDVIKCLRLLKERFFWKTMRPDVVQWINKCSQCNRKKMNKAEVLRQQEEPESLLQSPQIQAHSDSGRDNDDSDDEEEGGESGGEEDGQPAVNPQDRAENPCLTPINPQPRTSIILHLKSPINLQSRTSNTPFVARLVPIKTVNPLQTEVQFESQPVVQIQVKPQRQEQTQDQTGTGSQGSARTHHYIQAATKCLPEPRPPLELMAALPKATIDTQSKCQTSSQPWSCHRIQHPVKRRRDPEAGPSSKRSSSCGLEPVVAPSSKPWPVFTIAGPTTAQTAKPPAEGDGPAPVQTPRKLQARTIVQQCSQAKVKIKPAVDGVDAEWAEIQEGVVVYVCFFDGATEDVTYEMANSLMTTKLFRKSARHTISLLDLPGSVLFIPQDSLAGEPAPKRRLQYKRVCEPWRGAQLFSSLVSTCTELMLDSVKCRKAGVKVEQGVYGQKQEIVLNSAEPLTLLLEF
ncbi:uncharacterized protein [Channa argus]|uniref:uncharacterized protein isoform X1 n=2 Tax=Channa argus TaxID=215402 RepID=UPI0029445BF9|nr:hypothetical protein Q8A73_017947 [Channa argus]